MNNWDKWRRMQCNIEKAMLNAAVANLTTKHYEQLYRELVRTPEDMDVFQDTYLKLTYKYNPDKDFMEQFRWIFNQLKGAYYRDDKANHFYQIAEDRLAIPDIIPDSKPIVDTSIVDRLKAYKSYQRDI